MFIHLDSVDSTNAEAKRRILRGEGAHADTIIADVQTQGRGRRDHVWQSPLGNLYFSIIITPRLQESAWARYSLLSAVILSRVLGSIIDPDRFLFKWPNDVLIDEHKVSGLLIEALHHEGQPFLIIGVGVNILHHPFDSDFPATSLAACGVSDILPDRFLQRFMAEFDVNWQAFQNEGFAVFYQRIEQQLYGLGKKICLALSEEQHKEGICRGIDEEGQLLLEDENGVRRAYTSGDVLAMRPRF